MITYDKIINEFMRLVEQIYYNIIHMIIHQNLINFVNFLLGK